MAEYSATPEGVLRDPDNADFQPLNAPPLLGSSVSTAMLILIAVIEESYPAQLARLLGSSISSVQRTLDRLEREGLIATRKLGVRRVTLNPLYPAANELKALLLRLADGYPEYAAIKDSLRRRPRRRGKPL
jgi:DNA-binding transcriptional ArsR family regulator